MKAQQEAEDAAVLEARIKQRVQVSAILELAALKAARALDAAIDDGIGVTMNGGLDSAAVAACRLALQAAGHLKEQVDVTSGGEQVGGFVIPMKKPHG